MTGNPRPYDFAEYRAAVSKASQQQALAERSYADAAQGHAKAEESYRLALAKEIVAQHDAGGAWAVAADLARGQAHVASLRRDRDIAEGVREAMQHALWRHAANRKSLDRMGDWSMRTAPDGQYEQRPGEADQPVFGARAA